MLTASSGPCIGIDGQVASISRENHAFCAGQADLLPDWSVRKRLKAPERENPVAQCRPTRQPCPQSAFSWRPSGKCRIETVNGFRKLQQRLREEGWYIGWNHYCCQNCAWDDVPDEFEDGTEIDLNKVLFNHSQDCEFDIQKECYKCKECNGDGFIDCESCENCEERGYTLPEDQMEGLLILGGFICYPPEIQRQSLFCFCGDDEGVENLKQILPIIEESGCQYSWDGTGQRRIEISW